MRLDRGAAFAQHIKRILGETKTGIRNAAAGLGMDYHNIQVEWENPTVANFVDYVTFMDSPAQQGVTLTHCKLNWRGAVFTYLYRVIRLQEDEAAAREDMLAIWQPNETWQQFINKVKQHYQAESFSGK